MNYFIAKIARKAAANWDLAKEHRVWGPPTKQRQTANRARVGDRILFVGAHGRFFAVAGVNGDPYPFTTDRPAPWPGGSEMYPIAIPIRVLLESDTRSVNLSFQRNYSRDFGVSKADLQAGFRPLEPWQAAELLLALCSHMSSR